MPAEGFRTPLSGSLGRPKNSRNGSFAAFFPVKAAFFACSPGEAIAKPGTNARPRVAGQLM